MISREKAVNIVEEHVTRKNLFKHILAVEAIMGEMARELGEDEDIWAMAGLLHDVDFDETYEYPERHATRSIDILEEEVPGEVPEEILRAIKAHNFEHTGEEPQSNMENALIAADAVSGLIVAAALIMPSKKLSDLESDNVANRFKEKDFARSCSRESMLYCEKVGIPRDRFFELSLKALQGISEDLGL